MGKVQPLSSEMQQGQLRAAASLHLRQIHPCGFSTHAIPLIHSHPAAFEDIYRRRRKAKRARRALGHGAERGGCFEPCWCEPSPALLPALGLPTSPGTPHLSPWLIAGIRCSFFSAHKSKICNSMLNLPLSRRRFFPAN